MRTGVVAAFALVMAMKWSATAQTRFAPLKGTVLDSTTAQPLEAATVSVFKLKDSTLVSYAVTNKKGEFLVPNIPKSTACRLVISYSGLNSYSLDFSIPEESKELIIRTVGLPRAITDLQEVTVARLRPPVTFKKDTLEFNASSFKTRENAVVEDLLKELPGVTVDPDGTILVNGKKVSKITVNGRDFFGTDVKLTSKNLPRDIIDKIQVTDFKTKEQQFAGTRATGQEKSINLVLKKDKKKGIFGRSTGSYGSEDRYEAGATLNKFDAKSQLSVIGYANNTTGQNTGTGGISLAGGSGGQGLFRVAGAGINANVELSTKLRMTVSTFSSSDRQIIEQSVNRQNILPDSMFNYISKSSNKLNNLAHRGAVQLEFRPDSLTEINISGSVNLSRQTRINSIEGTSLSAGGQRINENNSSQTGSYKSPGLNAQFFAGRRFKKPGRIFTVNLGINSGLRAGTELIGSNTIFFAESGLIRQDSIRQRTEIEGSDLQLSGSATWIEPITKRINLRAAFAYNQKRGRNDRLTWALDSLTGFYNIPDSLFTSLFVNKVTTYSPSFHFDYSGNKLTAFAGIAVQKQNMENARSGDRGRNIQSFVNLVPSANLNLQISGSKMLMINYSGFSQPPSVEQLQPVPDITNPLYIRHGNPDLKPSFAHNMSLNFQQTRGQTYWNTSVNFATTTHLIVEEIWQDSVQHARSINSEGNHSINFNAGYSTASRWGKHSLRWSLGPSLSYSRNMSYTNKKENKSTSFGVSPRINITYSWGDWIVVQPTYSVSYFDMRYSLQDAQATAITSHNVSIATQLSLPFRLSFEGNFQYTTSSLNVPGIPRTISLLNAAINYYVDKKKTWMLRLTAFDIFNQNTNVRRIVTPAFIENAESMMLRQYFLAGITWHLKQFD